MGQRLVITVQKNGKDIAKLYYHWSAYSCSAISTTKQLLDYLDNEDNENLDPRLACLRFVQTTGGGIMRGDQSEEFAYIRSLFPEENLISTGYSRNDGLIALSENGMNDLQSWSDGDVYIDLDERVVYNYVNCTYGSLDELNEYRRGWCDEEDYIPIKYNSPIVYHSSINISEFYFEDIDQVFSTICDCDRSGLILEFNDTYYTLIS